VTSCNIGVSNEEKNAKQQLTWYIELHFQELPLGCASDLIQDTLCYDTIARMVSQECNARACNLIEHLCLNVYNKIKTYVHKIPITVRVLKAPVGDLMYKAQFTISDLE
jgi:dihydroneopterin aldolase